MSEGKLWAWRITVVNGRVEDVDATPIDFSTMGVEDAHITSMYRRRHDYVVEIETVAATRTDAERYALERFERDVPDDMRGR